MRLTDPHTHRAEECLEALAAAADGLSAPEALRRLAQHGPNLLPEVRARGPLLRFLAQFNNVLIYVLLGSAMVTAGL
jgi:magnesium-transporting ATPase (P-type)